LRNRNCFLALSYSILEATRQWSEGGCTAFADEPRSAKLIVMTTGHPVAAKLFLTVHDRPPFIGSSLPKAR
jgi:hypothetical protein